MANIEAAIEVIASLWAEEERELERLRAERAGLRRALWEALDRRQLLEEGAARFGARLETLKAGMVESVGEDGSLGASEELRREFAELKAAVSRMDTEREELESFLVENGVRGPDWAYSYERVRDGLDHDHDSAEQMALKRRLSTQALGLASAVLGRAKDVTGLPPSVLAGSPGGPAPASSPAFSVESTGGPLDPERVRRERAEAQRRRDERALAHGRSHGEAGDTFESGEGIGGVTVR